jgi:hypothetical protein
MKTAVMIVAGLSGLFLAVCEEEPLAPEVPAFP